MRILRVIESMNPITGGPCQGIRNSIPALESLNCHNEVVCLDSPDAPFLASAPFPIHALGKGRTSLRYQSELIPWLTSNLERFDAVIVHGFWLWTSIATHRAVRRRRRSVAGPGYYIMPHGMLDPWFQQTSARRAKALRNRIYWGVIGEKIIRDADGLLFTSEEELLQARRSFHPYQPKKEILVGYGVPPPPSPSQDLQDEFLRRCPGMPAGHSYLLFLGRIDPKKGVDLLIEAYARVYAPEGSGFAFPDAKVPHLVIAGASGHEYARRMISLARLLLPGRVSDPASGDACSIPASGPAVHFTDMLHGHPKWGAYYGCEAFILPSHQENFGIAVVEALSCGRPVLISDKVNIWREIRDAGAGLVGTDTVAGTVDVLKSWKSLGPEARREAAAAAEACYGIRYHIDRPSQKLLAVLANQT
jgi:glycosyltransferase involved in cell wall biosynthesis